MSAAESIPFELRAIGVEEVAALLGQDLARPGRQRHPAQVAEMALAHAIEDETEAAYRRGALLAKRRRLMADWAAYLAGAAGGNVVPLRATQG